MLAEASPINRTVNLGAELAYSNLCVRRRINSFYICANVDSMDSEPWSKFMVKHYVLS